MENDNLKRAHQLFTSGQVDSAIDVLKAAVSINPDDGACWELLGILLHREEQILDAVDALERATTLSPLTTGGQLALAICYGRLKLRESAHSIYAYLTDSGRVPVHILPFTVKALAGLGDFRRALMLCRRAAQRNPECDQALYGVAYYMSKCGYPREVVLPVLDKVVDLAPEIAQYRIALATLYQQLEQNETAVRILSRLTLAQLSEVNCPRCLRRLADLFDTGSESAKRDFCLSRVEMLESASIRNENIE